jgi:predicted methyltransferase
MIQRRTFAAALLAGAAAAAAATLALAADPPAMTRPQADMDRDAARKPAEMVAFAGIKPGSKVGELLPGAGYFTRVFAAAAGPTGKVYAWIPTQAPAAYQTRLDPITSDPAYANVTVLHQASPDFSPPEPLDVVFTAQNYHDMHNNGQTPDAVNAAVFKALKPGGVYVVVDHAAKDGSGVSASSTLHRIDPAVVKAEVTKAGFKFDGESTVLRRDDDPHTAKVFELHDKTDQFAYRFKKPG